MSQQTPVKVSVLTKIIQYFELAAALGTEVPEVHVQAISNLIEQLVMDLQSGVTSVQTAHQQIKSGVVAPPPTGNATPVAPPPTS